MKAIEHGYLRLASAIVGERLPEMDAGAEQRLGDSLDLAMSTLPDRERALLGYRFGLDDGYLHTLEEVGRRFGITRERVRQVEAKALRHLRHPARMIHLRPHLPPHLEGDVSDLL